MPGSTPFFGRTDIIGDELLTVADPMEKIDPRLEVVVLAAGQGTRMASSLPKVLHSLAGRPLLRHVLDTVAQLEPAQVQVVVGHQAEQVRSAIGAYSGAAPGWVAQVPQRGTGHAVQQALPAIGPDSVVLVVYGDVPLVEVDGLRRCAEIAASGAVAVLTAEPDDPAQLGRIVRDSGGEIRGIVEFRDASAAEREIREINSGIMAVPEPLLRRYLERLEPKNAQNEYYLTDVIAMAVADGIVVRGVPAGDAESVLGVNDRLQLAVAERCFQRRSIEALMRQGVTVADPARVDIRGSVSAGQDCYFDVNLVFEGTVALGRNVHIGPGAVIRNSTLGDGVRIDAYTLVDGAEVAEGCTLGPFARIRPGTRLGSGVRIGNFVETKKTSLGAGSKANHLAYLGDATIGEDCNIGAGTVTCNYDGIDKHPTHIGDRVFVGTNSTLVAPLEIGADAFVAAGSTVTAPVKSGELAVGRGRQRNVRGWVRPDRRKSKGGS